MKETPKNGRESSNSAHISGMNEGIYSFIEGKLLTTKAYHLKT
jgi:hypothetical protein